MQAEVSFLKVGADPVPRNDEMRTPVSQPPQLSFKKENEENEAIKNPTTSEEKTGPVILDFLEHLAAFLSELNRTAFSH